MTIAWKSQRGLRQTTLGRTRPSSAMEWRFRTIPWPRGHVSWALKRRSVEGWHAFQWSAGGSPAPSWRSISSPPPTSLPPRPSPGRSPPRRPKPVSRRHRRPSIVTSHASGHTGTPRCASSRYPRTAERRGGEDVPRTHRGVDCEAVQPRVRSLPHRPSNPPFSCRGRLRSPRRWGRSPAGRRGGLGGPGWPRLWTGARRAPLLRAELRACGADRRQDPTPIHMPWHGRSVPATRNGTLLGQAARLLSSGNNLVAHAKLICSMENVFARRGCVALGPPDVVPASAARRHAVGRR